MKIYPKLNLLWIVSILSTLISAAAALFGGTMEASAAVNVLALAVYAVTLVVLYKLREQSARFWRAFAYQLATLIFSVLAVVSALFAAIEMMLLFSVMLLWVAALFSLFSNYQLYWALDERIIPCGYQYPARRIRWCFYVPLCGGLCVTLLQLGQLGLLAAAVQLISQIVPLVLFWQYNQAVRQREDDPLIL